MTSVSSNQTKGSLFSFLINRGKRREESLEIRGDQLIFTGGSKYLSVATDNIEGIEFVAREEPWQEVILSQKSGSGFSYYFYSDPESLKAAVAKANNDLGPVQPICKFILSAKQGSLSGRD